MPDQYKTQEMCDKAVDNAHALKVAPDCYKNQKMCCKTVNTYPFTARFVPE